MSAQPDRQSPQSLLPRWANGQDSWARVIAADVLKNRVQCAGSDIDRYLKVLLAEKKLSEDPFGAIARIEEKQLDGNPLRLDTLRIGDGNNALKPATINCLLNCLLLGVAVVVLAGSVMSLDKRIQSWWHERVAGGH